MEAQLEALDLERVARRIKKTAVCVQTVVIRISNLHLRKDVMVMAGNPLQHTEVEDDCEYEDDLP